jgi:hypothetical protein
MQQGLAERSSIGKFKYAFLIELSLATLFIRRGKSAPSWLQSVHPRAPSQTTCRPVSGRHFHKPAIRT